MEKFRAVVIFGNQIGQKFGVATANLKLEEEFYLNDGVYFVNVTIENKKYEALLHIGKRKTFHESFSIEVHILDFQENLYGKIIIVQIIKFHRYIYKFNNADQLFTKIEQDIVQARKFFLRKKIYKKWTTISVTEKQNFEKIACYKIFYNKFIKKSTNIFIYLPDLNCEICFVSELLKKYPDKKFFFPKIISKNLVFVQTINLKNFKKNKLGVSEPINTTPQQIPQKNDVLFVPALAASLDGYRLGRGGGYYDRFIQKYPNSYKITVVPKFAIYKNLEKEKHDELIDELIIV